MSTHTFSIHTTDTYQYWDEGAVEAPILLYLHGMLGNLQNWKQNVLPFTNAGYRVIAPLLPCYTLPLRQTNIHGLVNWVREFVSKLLPNKVFTLVGNSLGGQIALFYAYQYPDQVKGLVLTGSAGVRELSMKGEYFRRHDTAFLREHASYTFYDQKHVTDELLDEVQEIVTNREYALRLIALGRSSKKEVVTTLLPEIQIPTMLIWGEKDRLTEPSVAYELHEQLPNSRLAFIPNCGHAPMLEQPEFFNDLLLRWLLRLNLKGEITVSSAKHVLSSMPQTILQ